VGRADEYLEELKREFAGLRLVRKQDDALSGTIDRLLRIATFGAMSTYASQYTTVLFHTIYTPSSWETRSDTERYITLRHEAVHLRQMKRYGYFVMGAMYALPILPIGLAWGRARIEWEAYAETLRAIAEVNGVEAARSTAVREHIVKQFTSAAYGWMWPFPRVVNGWIDAELANITLLARKRLP
jgi:hypothetical protein